ncbi:hypothetical protein [Nonomuraea lactucae]|uniref:hypothetical protein n=1 Tax=Nonomuraea lactucae TaxID=2249762 RepID=UPI000DE2E605|nr:hypothetical protein [Nonomuraea lactucae]
MNFCLSDLVPPLRWSDASTITLLTGQPDLPDAWWRSLPLTRVLAAIGPEGLGELLTEIALERWPAAAVGDVLPALYVLDPDEVDEPHIAIALDRAGSWAGLLALTSRELLDQPFIQARAVLGTLFSAVLVRVSPTPSRRAGEAARHGAETSEPAEEPAGAQDEQPVQSAEPAVSAKSAEPVEPEDEVSAALDASEEDDDSADAEASLDEAPQEGEAIPEGEASPEGEDSLEGEDSAEAEAADGVDSLQEEAPPAAANSQEEAALAAEGAEGADGPASGEAAADNDPADNAPADDPAAGDPAADDDADEEAPVEEAPDYRTPEDHEPAEAGSPDLPELIEAAFAGLDDKTWAVAQNRVFTDQPSAVDQLARLFAVPPAEIDETEVRLRARLDRWLASDEAAPYRAHLDELLHTIGPAAPKERLIKAADWHLKEIRALEVPAWQFVLATMTPRESEGGGAADLPPPATPSAFSPPGQAAAHPSLGSPFAALPQADGPTPGSRFQAFAPAVPVKEETNGVSEDGAGKPYQPLKDVSQTRRCFRQPDGRWWLRVDVTAEQLAGGECPLPTGFAAYLGLSPGESRAVRSAAGELTMTWHGRPVLESVERLLVDVGAKEGGHLFLTLSDEGVLRARHLPVAAQGAEKITKALRLVGYTAPGGTREQAARVIATRIGMAGPVVLPDLITRLRERGDRDLLDLLD